VFQTESIQLSIKTGTDSIVDSVTERLEVSASPGTLTSSVLTTDSDFVGVSTSWDVTFTPDHPIPGNGKVLLTFPFWNAGIGATGTSRTHFL
jgi:hypothetical protein